MRFVAFLRGINVGGKNVVRMADLQRVFESLGFQDVATVIASGNVVFSAPKRPHAARIEQGLSKAFGYEARVVVRSASQLRQLVKGAPRGWPLADTRCYVVLTRPPLTPARLLEVAPPRAGVDVAATGVGAVYYGTRKEARSRSGLQKLLATPEYRLVTIRDFKTCARIRATIDLPDAK